MSHRAFSQLTPPFTGVSLSLAVGALLIPFSAVSAQTPPVTLPPPTNSAVVLASPQPRSGAPDSDVTSEAVVRSWLDTTGYFPPQTEGDVVGIQVDPNDLQDVDGDGLDGMEEALVGSDPEKADTDGDGVLDGVEVRADELLGLQPSDPLNRNDIPVRLYGEYFLDDLVTDLPPTNRSADETLTTPVPASPPVVAGVASGTPNESTNSVQRDGGPGLPKGDGGALIPLKPDPLLYRSDGQVNGEGYLPASIYDRLCERSYAYQFLNWHSIPVEKRDLHQFSLVVGMQAWLDLARQVAPGHLTDCPDVAQTQFRSGNGNVNLTVTYTGQGQAVSSTTSSSGRPSFAALRMASWSQMRVYLHELGHAVGLGHTVPLSWSAGAGGLYSAYATKPYLSATAPVMSYGHITGWKIPECAGHPNDEQRLRAFYAKRVKTNRSMVCGLPVACKVKIGSLDCVDTLPKGANPKDYQDALHRPCWPTATPQASAIKYGEWTLEDYRCSKHNWRLIVTFVPRTDPRPISGKCFVGIGELNAAGKVTSYLRRGIGAYWEPRDRGGAIIPKAKRTASDCGIHRGNAGLVILK